MPRVNIPRRVTEDSPRPDLDEVNGLVRCLLPYGRGILQPTVITKAGMMYCPRCGERCNMDVRTFEVSGTILGVLVHELTSEDTISVHERYSITSPQKPHASEGEPNLLLYFCVNCDAEFTTLVYALDQDIRIAIFPGVEGGFATKRTPKEVAYYANQAFKAKSAGAYSAVFAMLRAALHQLLEQQGMNGSMTKMLADLSVPSKGPAWSTEIDSSILENLKKLGDFGMHGDDLSKLQAADAKAANEVCSAFKALLEIVYEEPADEDARLKLLKSKLAQAKNKPAAPPTP